MKFVFQKHQGPSGVADKLVKSSIMHRLTQYRTFPIPLVRPRRQIKVVKTNILKLHAQKTENLTNEKKAEGFLFLAFLKFLGQSNEYLGAFGFIVTR